MGCGASVNKPVAEEAIQDTDTNDAPKAAPQEATKDSETNDAPKTAAEEATKGAEANDVPKTATEEATKDSETNDAPKTASEEAAKDSEAEDVPKIATEEATKDAETNDAPKAWLMEKKVGVLSQGPDGTLLQEGPTEELSRVFVVFDPRILHESGKFATAVEEKVKVLDPTAADVVVLVPAACSAPQYAVSVEAGLQYLSFLPAKLPEAKVKFVLIDEYYQNPGSTLEVLAANPEKTCYTGSAAPPTQLSVFFTQEASLGYKEMGYPEDPEEGHMEIHEDAERFDMSVWSFRAFCHWAVGFGVEEGAIIEFHETLKEECKKDDVLCPACEKVADGSVSLVPKTAPTGKTVGFYAFSNLEELGRRTGCTVIQADPEGSNLIDAVRKANHIPVILLYPEDVKETSYEPFVNCITTTREAEPEMTLTVVLLNESFEAHCSNPWLVPCLNQLIENVDIGIFAVPEELPDVVNLLTIPGEHVPFAIATNSIAFPRLHFFTMGTAMGQTLEDHEIFGSAVTCGPMGSTSGLETSKFLACKKKWAAMVLQNENCEAMVERLLIQSSSTSSSTLIAPHKLLAKIVRGARDQVQPFRPERGEGEEEEENHSGLPCWTLLPCCLAPAAEQSPVLAAALWLP
mmetsp:Transcript_72944/g.189413  ORF Transcript_72944/g.189413 Transcript_72944/m.189413 type:complete len:632 (+) Transcript_72944:95-1990(+)